MADVICPGCRAGFRRLELDAGPPTEGEHHCPACGHILEVFDGRKHVACRLTIQPSIKDVRDYLPLAIGIPPSAANVALRPLQCVANSWLVRVDMNEIVEKILTSYYEKAVAPGAKRAGDPRRPSARMSWCVATSQAPARGFTAR